MKKEENTNAGRDPETGLEEEGVHLGDLEDHADEGRLHEALEGPEDVPGVVLPATPQPAAESSPHRGELLQEALRLATAGFDLGEAHPVVLARLELPVDPHADTHAQQVAAEHVRDHLVPPAFLEVGQDVLRGHLQVLEPHGEHPQDAPVAEDEGLPNPAQEVRENKDVAKHVLHVLEVIRVLGNVDSAVRGVIAIQQGHAKTVIEEFHKLASLGGRQGQNEQQQALVQHRDAQHNLPHYGMGARNGTLLELCLTAERIANLIRGKYDNKYTYQEHSQSNTIHVCGYRSGTSNADYPALLRSTSSTS